MREKGRMKLISKFNLSPSNSRHSYTVWLPPLSYVQPSEVIWNSFRDAILSPIHTLWISKWPFHNWNEIASGTIEFSNRLPSASSQTCLYKSSPRFPQIYTKVVEKLMLSCDFAGYTKSLKMWWADTQDIDDWLGLTSLERCCLVCHNVSKSDGVRCVVW